MKIFSLLELDLTHETQQVLFQNLHVLYEIDAILAHDLVLAFCQQNQFNAFQLLFAISDFPIEQKTSLLKDLYSRVKAPEIASVLVECALSS